MKYIVFSLICILASLSTFASNVNVATHEPSSSETGYSPQVCQFSLTSYSGTISSAGNTKDFKVGLSCPQQEDVRATVVVFINGEHVGSKVVTVKAGKDYSESVSINVGTEYYQKQYKLVVQ